MGKRLFWASATTLCLLFTACSGDDDGESAALAETTATEVRALADEYVETYYQAFPHHATLAGRSGADHARLPDHSLVGLTRWQEQEDRLLERLRLLDPTALTDTAEGVTYGFLENLLTSAVRFRECKMELWNVSPTFTGWQAEMSLLASVQPVSTEAERRQAVERFGGLGEYIDEEIANLRSGVELGFSAPRHNVEMVIDQMDALEQADGANSPFTSMAAEGGAFRAELDRIVQETIRPAILRYSEFLRTEYLPQARTSVGVNSNPDGESCYAAAVRYFATLDMPPDEIHQTGLRQMAKIQDEMSDIGERSFANSDVASLLQELKTNPDYLFKTREQMIEYAEDAVERAKAAVPGWFGLLPSATVVVEPFPSFQEKNAPGGQYNLPAEDGSRSGIYLINTYRPEQRSVAGVESTAFHETYPGHHHQTVVALERGNLHAVQRYFFVSGFGEGWALYAERLADEMGLFSSEIDRIGLLSNEALRAARLVVDSGLHALGWSRQQAIDYMNENTAEALPVIAAEVDRYIAVPGQATAYMLGNLEIRRLRNLAEARLGESFDVKQFHDLILEDGTVPLSMLKAKIEGWIEKASEAS